MINLIAHSYDVAGRIVELFWRMTLDDCPGVDIVASERLNPPGDNMIPYDHVTSEIMKSWLMECFPQERIDILEAEIRNRYQPQIKVVPMATAEVQS